MQAHCPHCACNAAEGGDAHALLALLALDDLDAALERGLLDAHACPACDTACNARLADARDARRVALAARTRYRARVERLARGKAERDATRRPAPMPVATGAPASSRPVLPPSAADVLARALAKAAARGPR